MFALEQINEERIKFQDYTSYDIPIIQNVLYENTNNFYAKIKKQDISNGNYVLHLSNKLDTLPLGYQKSIIWHEFVHLYDTFFINLEGDDLYYALSTYSEAHAESIKLRYLLHIPLKAKIGDEIRKLIGENGETTLYTEINNYFKNCSAMSHIIDIHPTPECFNLLINYFCYFCGYLFLLKKENADKKIIEATKKLSDSHAGILLELYKVIMDKDFKECATIYKKLHTTYKEMALNKRNFHLTKFQ